MNRRLTRRRFGRLAIAGTTVAGLGYLASKTIAQQPSNLVIVGIDRGDLDYTQAPGITNIDSNGAETTDSTDTDSTQAPTTTRDLVLQSFSLNTSQIGTLPTPQSLVLNPGERLADLAYLADGTLVVVITPVSTSKKGGNSTRLVLLGQSPKNVTVSGLKKQEELQRLLLLNDGSFAGLVGKKNRTSPFRLVVIDPQTGQIGEDRIKLPKEQFSNLAQCPDGKLYSTVFRQDGDTDLVQFDLGKKKSTVVAKLTINGDQWNNGLQSLVCSPTGQLIALGALRYKTFSALYTISTSTGAMTKIEDFNVARIAITPA